LQHQRHNEIIKRLRNGETLSITELAKEWHVPTKTIQRDFKKLTEGDYGIIRAEDGKRFVLKKSHQTTSGDALLALKMLESFAADMGGSFYTKAQSLLKRIEKHIHSPFYSRINVEDISKTMPIIEEIEQAITNHQIISFDYERPYKPGELKHYSHIKPYKIIIFDGFFYLFGLHHNYFPKFYLKSISNLYVHKEYFTHDEDVLSQISKAHNIWFDPAKEGFEVTFYVDSVAIIYFERKPLNRQYLKKYQDGTAEVTITITNKEEAFSLMKKWLPHIKILEPVKLQQEFEEMLQEYIFYCNK